MVKGFFLTRGKETFNLKGSPQDLFAINDQYLLRVYIHGDVMDA